MQNSFSKKHFTTIDSFDDSNNEEMIKLVQRTFVDLKIAFYKIYLFFFLCFVVHLNELQLYYMFIVYDFIIIMYYSNYLVHGSGLLILFKRFLYRLLFLVLVQMELECNFV